MLLAAPLILSAFTHLWNINGIPFGPSYDEGIYLRRSMHVLEGQGPQESYLYDHPYFAQLILGSILALIGYPNSLNPTLGNVNSIEMLYAVPRIIIGIFAIIDTFLIYKISEYHYNKTVAFFASLLFAIMPLSWDTRRVLLESVQLPFLLTSILFAVMCYKKYVNVTINGKQLLFIFLSGASLGLAIFTKIPGSMMIPLAGFLIYRNNNRNLKALGLWLIPVILIPSIWPAYAMYIHQFEFWLHGIYFQTHRSSNLLFQSTNKIYYDTVLISLALIGVLFAIKRDLFIFLGLVPYLIYLYFIGYISFWHLIPLLPIVCILCGRVVQVLLKRSHENKKITLFWKILSSSAISVIVAAGLINIVMMLTIADNSFNFKAAAFVTQILKPDNDQEKGTTLISNAFFSWIPKYVFHFENYSIVDYYDNIPVRANSVILINDNPWKVKLSQHMINPNMEENFDLYGKNKIATYGDSYHGIEIFSYNASGNATAKIPPSINTGNISADLTSPSQ